MPNEQQIAETIRQQIKAGEVGGCQNGLHAMMCWAARSFSYTREDDKSLGGLRFKVSGRKHKGSVWVKLAFNDTYIVEFINLRGRIIETLDDVYCDMLAEVIDNHVESGGN